MTATINSKPTKKSVKQLTRQYVALKRRIAMLEEQLDAIKAQVIESAPEGATTLYGVWQPYAESMRTSYTPAKVSKLIEQFIMEGHTEQARALLDIKTESTIPSGMKFIIKK